MNSFEKYWAGSISASVISDYESGNVKTIYADSKKKSKKSSSKSKEEYDNDFNFDDELYDHQLDEIESRVAVRIYAEKKNKRSFDY